ncbi:MAG: class I SAM-dependent methyltransferase [Acidimicrobiales bacterium]
MTGPLVNVEQAQEWNTGEGEHWVVHQDRYDRLLAPFTVRLLNTAGVRHGDAVLDVGCGCGATTRNAAGRAEHGEAVGVDLSEPMLARGRELAADDGLTNVRFEQGDAEVHVFGSAGFDVAISRFGVMFFADPVRAFANIATALRPRGRLVFSCWRAAVENEWIMIPAGAALAHVPLPDLGDETQPGPFSFASRDRVQYVLAQAGFADIEIEPVDEPLRLGSDAEDTVRFIRGTGMAQRLLAEVSPDVADQAMRAIEAALGPYVTSDGVVLGSAAWLVSARRGDETDAARGGHG